MAWIGLYLEARGRAQTRYDPALMARAAAPDALLARGTLRFELDLAAGGAVPCQLIRHQSRRGWRREFIVYLNADRSVSVASRQGPAQAYGRLERIDAEPAGPLTVTYSWDAPRRRALLCIEDRAGDRLWLAALRNPIPLPLLDAAEILSGGAGARLDPRITCLAVSDRVEPVGPVATIAAGTLIDTPEGARPIESLRLGEQVLTLDNGPQPVRWVLSQYHPAGGLLAPICLRAPYFALRQDVRLAAVQRLLIGGPAAEYHLGRTEVLVEAGRLQGHPGALCPDGSVSEHYCQILLDGHECINAAGTWVDSLHIGRLAEQPEILACSALAGLPRGLLPVHRRRVRPALQRHEAPALQEVLPA